MLPFELRPADLDTVKIERNSHSSARVRSRLWVIWFLHQGFSRGRSAELAGVNRDTVTNIVRTYHDQGIGPLFQSQCGGKSAKHALAKKFKRVKKSLLKASIHTVNQARAHLAAKFGYSGGWESTRQLLHRLGLRCRKINPFPGNPKKFKVWRKA